MTITTTRALVAAAIAAAIMNAAPASAQAPVPHPAADPQEVIADLKSRLFASLDRETVARRNTNRMLILIDQLLAPRFDADYTARLVLGRHWNDASVSQRQQFAVAFYQRLLRNYESTVAGWTAERIKVLPLNVDAAALQVTVRTLVRSSGAADARVDYRLRQTDEGWRIFDVIVDGVSYARSYHDDIDADVSHNGIDAAIARLNRNDTSASGRASTGSQRQR
jgi:phospholipid transport system substrate-binding protein